MERNAYAVEVSTYTAMKSGLKATLTDVVMNPPFTVHPARKASATCRAAVGMSYFTR